MDIEDLKKFKANLSHTLQLVGDQNKYSLPEEAPARANARRSLVASRNIDEGTEICMDHLTWKRPAHGISPRCIREVLGKRALRKISEDEVLQWNMLS